MKINKFLSAAAVALIGCCMACSDDVSQIGTSLANGEVVIENDSTFQVVGRSVRTPQFDSRSVNTLIGHINVPEYGDLSCSFVSQMLSASALSMPDSLGVERVDSMKMVLRLVRGTVTGDSLAPQQLSVYRLTEQLPSGISSNFDPSGYYNPSSPMGIRNYSMSALGFSDSIYKKNATIDVKIDLPREQAVKIVEKYRNDPQVFQWPSSFNKFFPGIFVRPSFGRGCVANVAKTDFIIYYYKLANRSFTSDGKVTTKQVHVRDSAVVFGSAPEVISSNNINYTPSQSLEARIANGETIIVAPSGYNVEIEFPLKDVIAKYNSDKFNMAVINDLTFHVPAQQVKNDHGIIMAPHLLMVKTSDVNEFFANNRLPDGKTSFWATYSTESGGYEFTSMRAYLIDMLAKPEIEPEDTQFTILPVYITTETYRDPETYNEKTAVISCTPYMVRPTMTRLLLNEAKVKFLYSIQKIN